MFKFPFMGGAKPSVMTKPLNGIYNTYSKLAYGLRNNAGNMALYAGAGAGIGGLAGAMDPNSSFIGGAGIGAASGIVGARAGISGRISRTALGGSVIGSLYGGYTGGRDSGPGFWNTTGGIVGGMTTGSYMGMVGGKAASMGFRGIRGMMPAAKATAT